MSQWRRLPEGAPTAEPRPIDDERVERLFAPPNGGVPNHPWLEALLYPGALAADETVERIKALFEASGWFRVWDWTVYPYHHFHPRSHEVLAVARGRAALRLGGEAGATREVGAGDALVLPAGFGHRRLDASEDFTVVGAYPEGQEEREVVRAGEAAMRAALETLGTEALPAADPLFGADGPLTRLWRAPAATGASRPAAPPRP